MLGLDVGEDDSSFFVDGRATNGYVRGDHVGGYAGARQGAAYLLATLQGDFFRSSTDRIFQPLGDDEHIHGVTHAQSVTGRLEGGYALESRWLELRGFVAAQVSDLHVDGYAEKTESGPDLFALAYAARQVTLPQSDLGLELRPAGEGPAGVLTPYVRLTWRHSFEVDRSVDPSFESFAPPSSFRVFGAAAARDEAVVDLRTDWRIARDLVGFASLGGEYGGSAYDTTADVGLRWRW